MDASSGARNLGLLYRWPLAAVFVRWTTDKSDGVGPSRYGIAPGGKESGEEGRVGREGQTGCRGRRGRMAEASRTECRRGTVA